MKSIAFLFQSQWIALFPIAIAFWFLMLLADQQNERYRRSWKGLGIRVFIRMMLAVAVYGAFFRYGVSSLLLLLLLGMLAVFIWIRLRDMKRGALLMAILGCHHDRDAITKMAVRFSDNNVGFLRTRANRFLRLLYRELPLSSTLENSGLVRGVSKTFAVRMLDIHPQLSGMRRMLWGQERFIVLFEPWLLRMIGCMVVLAFLPLINLVFQLRISPMLKMIGAEFGATPSALTTWYFSSPAISIFFAILALVLFALVLIATVLYLFPRLSRIFPLEWFCRPYVRSWTLIGIADLLSFESNLEQSLKKTAACHPVNSFRFALLKAATCLRQGQTTADALVSSGLVSKRRIGGLALAKDARGMAWGLQRIAELEQDQLIARLSFWMQWFLVAIILSTAAMVALMAMVVFEWISHIIMLMD